MRAVGLQATVASLRACLPACPFCISSLALRMRLCWLQVDVEGSELEVLRGLDPGTWRLVRQVAAEVRRLPTADSLATRRGCPGAVSRKVESCSLFFQFFGFLYALVSYRCTTWETGWQRPPSCWRMQGLRCTLSAPKRVQQATGCSLHGSCLLMVTNAEGSRIFQ